MSIYDELQGVAKDILSEFSQDGIKYIALTPGSGPIHNPGTPTETSYVISDGVARGVEFKYIDGQQIVGSEGQITCGAPQVFSPKIHDYVIVSGQRHKIKKVTKIPATGTPIVYVIFYER